MPAQSGQPAFKAHALKLIIDRIKTLPEADEILGHVPPALSHLAGGARGAGWLGVEECWPLMVGLREVLGDERFVAFYREHTTASVDMPVFGTFVKSLINLFGSDPGGMSKHLGRAFALAMRDCGKMETQIHGPGHAVVSIAGLPDLLASDDTYALSTMGTLQTLFELTNTPGRVVPDLSRLSENLLAFDIEWQVGP